MRTIRVAEDLSYDMMRDHNHVRDVVFPPRLVSHVFSNELFYNKNGMFIFS